MHSDYLALQAPLETRDGRLVFRVPLAHGGDKLQLVAKTTSFVEDGHLVVLIPDWLAARIGLAEGTEVYVDDRWGKLNIARVK